MVFVEDISNITFMKKIEEKKSNKLSILSQISRELRMPLNTSIGLLQCLVDDFDSIYTKRTLAYEYISKSLNSNKILLNIIHNIRDIS